ncbi:MAG: hypothetical protein ACKO2P_18940 [Planctomycetota bacterium]
MIELIVLGMGFYGLCTGKFSASKGRMLTGGPARVCSLILLAHLPISFAGGFALGFFGMPQDSWYPLIVSLISLFLVITTSAIAANQYCTRLNVERTTPAQPDNLLSQATSINSDAETDNQSPYAVVGAPQPPQDSALRQIFRGLVLAGGLLCTAMITLFLNAQNAAEGVMIAAVVFGVGATFGAYRVFRPAAPAAVSP